MHRVSPKTSRVLDAIRESGRPLSAEELRADLAESGVGLATVYRALNAGVEDGSLRRVELPGGPARFEPADLPHHHHFQCDDCGRVYDVEGCPGRMDEFAPEGFSVTSHEIILRGACRACSDRGAP